MPKPRKAKVERKTKETRISAELALDGQGKAQIATGLPFLDHMLTLFAVHGFFDLKIKAAGDLEVDAHHTVEDAGICLGTALAKALGEKEGIARYGHAVVPMDEACAAVTLDISNRPYLVYKTPELARLAGEFETELVPEFLRAFCQNGGITLHVRVLYGRNTHHMIEAAFKALGRALDAATQFDKRRTGIPSSKGSL